MYGLCYLQSDMRDGFAGVYLKAVPFNHCAGTCGVCHQVRVRQPDIPALRQ